MGRRGTIESLPTEEFTFVLRCLANGKTDRQISAEFEAEFKKPLPKSNLNRWRNKVGNELGEKTVIRKLIIEDLVETLEKKGIVVDKDDRFKLIIQNVEDKLLIEDQALLAENPLKLLGARQESLRIDLQREKLELEKQRLAFDREKHKNAVDRVKLGAETLGDFFEYIGDNPEGIKFLNTHLQPFETFLKKKYAGAES